MATTTDLPELPEPPRKPFAKVFDTERGQILLVLELEHDDGPSITVHADPGEPFGLCTTRLGYHESDEGRTRAREVFDAATADHAMKAAKPLFTMADEAGGDRRKKNPLEGR